MTISLWQHARRKRELGYDVAIVGGGIIGCSAAYWLRRRDPSCRVAILEARTLGAGASGRNAGFVLQGTHTDYLSDVERYGERGARRLWHFTRANRDLLVNELDEAAFDWRSDGSMTVAGSAEEDGQLRASLSHLRSAGAPVVYLDPDETNARLQSSGFHGALFVTTGAVVNPLKLVRHVATESGADIRSQHRVEDVHWRRNGVVLDTPELRVRARKVLLALGPSLPNLLPTLSEFVEPMRAQMLATAATDRTHIPVPVYSHDGGFYVRQLDDGTVLVGGGRHQHREAEQTSEDATTPAVQATIERYLHNYFPWTQLLSVHRRWSGTMGFSPDGLPVVGRVPGHPEGVYATGFTGHGMGYGFRMGRLLAQLLSGNEKPKWLDLFESVRFENGDSVESPTASTEEQTADG